MAFPSYGGGVQLTDGNVNEPVIGVMPDPATVTAAATLTAANLLTGLILANSGQTANQAFTLPTVANLEAALVNPKLNSTLEFVIVNLGTSSGTVTMTTNTGWTLTGLGNAVVAITSSARFRARKTSDTGWSLYRIA